MKSRFKITITGEADNLSRDDFPFPTDPDDYSGFTHYAPVQKSDRSVLYHGIIDNMYQYNLNGGDISCLRIAREYLDALIEDAENEKR